MGYIGLGSDIIELETTTIDALDVIYYITV
jgi:hypothetical protein